MTGVRQLTLLCAVTAALVLNGCSSTKNDGKYYDKDGPPSALGAIGMAVEDAAPKVEKPIAATNRPYTVMGKTYQPMTGDKPLVQTGYGSWYGKQFHGKKTSTGEIYNMYEMSAAHTTMELPSYAKVTNLENGKSVIVRVNDRGPFLHSRIIDLSYAAATKLGYVNKGTAKVKVERITRTQIAAGNVPNTSSGAVVALATPILQKALQGTTDSAKDAKRTDLIADIAMRTVQEVTSSGGSLVTADRVEIEKDNIGTAFKTAVSGKVSQATQEAKTTLGTFEQQAREEVIDALKQRAAETKIGRATAQMKDKISSAFYAVQLGVFKSDVNAQALKDKFNAALGDKISAPVRIETINGLHKVIVGNDMTDAQAKAAVAVIRDVLGIKAFVLKE